MSPHKEGEAMNRKAEDPTLINSQAGYQEEGEAILDERGEVIRLDQSEHQSGSRGMDELPEGMLLGHRYQILKRLGGGGAGVVYRAGDLKLGDREVVVKVLRQDLTDAAARRWFEQKFSEEIEALSRLRHVSVVNPLDKGVLPDGKPYLVMEHVEGGTLADALRQGLLALERAAGIVRQLGQALGPCSSTKSAP